MKPPNQQKSSPQETRINAYIRILKEDPESRVFAPLAEILAQKGMLEAAGQVCKKGLKAHPDFSDGHLAYARVLHLSRKYEEALREIEITVGLDAHKIQAHLIAAEIHLLRGHTNKLRQCCKKILELEPANVIALNHLRLCNQGISDREIGSDDPTKQDISRNNHNTRVLPLCKNKRRASVPQRKNPTEKISDRIDFSLSNLDSIQALIDSYSVRGSASEIPYSDKAVKVPRNSHVIWLSLLFLMLIAAVSVWFTFR